MYKSSVINDYNINSKEYCFNLEPVNAQPRSMKVNIPVLMPLIVKDKPTEHIERLDINGLLCNDVECRPYIDGVVTIQNYITLQCYIGESPNFEFKSDSNGIVPRFNKFIVDIIHNDVMNMHFTGQI